MKWVSTMVFCAIGWSGALAARTPEWHDEKMKVIEASKDMPRDQKIETLGAFARIGADRSAIPNDLQMEVYRRARDILITIPGHAEYYSKKIKDAQREVERQRGVSGREGAAKSKLLEEQMYGFETLSQLPTPETVKVLGEFLFDPWGLKPGAKPGEAPNNDKFGESSHADYALNILARLPLETRANTTPAERTTYWADIDAWKLWYEQVKAGNRTFRFEGDPQEYNLNGPVEKVSLARSRKGGPAEDDSAPVVAEETSRAPLVGLVAACMLLGGALWFTLGAKKRRKA